MRRLVALAVVLGLLPVAALAASGSTSEVIDNSAPGDVGASSSPSGADDAVAISQDIFSRRDDAYGAFQRGYYLTALSLALPRAERADPAAQTLIAEIYAKGLGVAQNVARASSWFALAAKNGDRLAAFELGMLYLNGDGVPKNPGKAADLFKQAADKGYPPAQYNLALMHVDGVDASPSLIEAARLMKATTKPTKPTSALTPGAKAASCANAAASGPAMPVKATRSSAWLGATAMRPVMKVRNRPMPSITLREGRARVGAAVACIAFSKRRW